jgi:hypothetical protein
MLLRCHECLTRFPAPPEETLDVGLCVPVYICPTCGTWGRYEDFDPACPVFDPSISKYIADDETGTEHFGNDFWACYYATEINDVDPMQPDYASLARQEPVTQTSDSRDAAF